MEQVQKKGAAVEELGGNFLTLLSSSIVNKFEKEFEGKGILFTPELSKQLRKLIVQSYNEIQTSSLTEDVDSRPRTVVEPSAQSTLPSLVFQIKMIEMECVMGMMINGKPEVVKNEKGSESTPLCAGVTDDNRLLYGTDAKIYCESRSCFYKFWCSFKLNRSFRTVHLKEFGIFDLPTIFFVALQIRKLKITAEESKCDGSLCQAAILAVPMKTTFADRLFLKEVALFAGFKDVYVISAEGLAAYYWFHKNETENTQNNYSKDFVIIEFSDWNAVVYKKSFEANTDGKKSLVVTPIVSLNGFRFGRFNTTKFRDEFVEMMTNRFKFDENAVIPVVGAGARFWLFSFSPQSLGNNTIERVDDNDNPDRSDYYAMKGAALLSGNPEKMGRQVRNMMETVSIEAFYTHPGIKITSHDQILPETFAQRTFTIKHVREKYRIRQNCEIVGYLVVNEVELGSDLQVTYEINWEGIWKVVGVSAKNPCDTDEGYEAVRWECLIGEKDDVPQFGRSSYDECRSLLLKILPPPSLAKTASTEVDSSGGFPPRTLKEAVEASASVCSSVDGNEKGKVLATKSTVTLPNDTNGSKFPDKLLKRARSSTSQVKRRSARLTKVGSKTSASGLGSSQDESVGLGSGTTDKGDRSEMKGKKRSRKGRVISTTDIVVNTGLKKIKLESDWVEPLVKIEQDSVVGLGEDGNGQQVNFVKHEIEMKEDVVKINVEEEENIAG